MIAEPATPWSKGDKLVRMTTRAWFVYHSAWLVCYRDGLFPDEDMMHADRALRGGIIFG